MNQTRGKELAPVPRKGFAHWGKVHVDGDRRAPLPPPPSSAADGKR